VFSSAHQRSEVRRFRSKLDVSSSHSSYLSRWVTLVSNGLASIAMMMSDMIPMPV
jgi:hypothetical protein